MPLIVFEICCVLVVLLTLAAMARTRGVALLLREYASLAVAGYIGEETCVAWYRFYAYAPGWHLRLHHVPILVPLIWPLVILSARSVATALFPRMDRALPIVVGLLVALDASLVEVVAVRAGLWSWAEPGHLGVPLIGILGWGYFAAGASFALDRDRAFLAIVLGPLTAHLLIQATWWGFFRFALRGPLGSSSMIGLAIVSLLALFIVIQVRRGGDAIPLSIAGPRMIAAVLFLALLITTAPRDLPLWAHAIAVAVPYIAATSFRGTRSPGAQLGARAKSPR